MADERRTQCKGLHSVSYDLGLNWQSCPACQPRQPPPQQEPLSLVADELRKCLSQQNGRNWLFLADAKGVMVGKSQLDVATEAVAELLRHQEQQARADEQARVVTAIEAKRLNSEPSAKPPGPPDPLPGWPMPRRG